jgi:hypothetical protein
LFLFQPPKPPLDFLVELGANGGQNDLLGSLKSHELVSDLDSLILNKFNFFSILPDFMTNREGRTFVCVVIK